MDTTHVIIIGAGPTGLTAGVELLRRGKSATIIEKRITGSTLSRAVGINPKSLHLLKKSGVTQQLLDSGVSYKQANFYDEKHFLVSIPFKQENIRHGHDIVLGLPQDQTEEILKNKFTELGGIIHYGTEFADIKQDDCGVTIMTRTGQEMPCDYALGADGIHSTVRKALNIPYEGYELKKIWSIADAELKNWNCREGPNLFMLGKGDVLVVVPFRGARCRVVSNTENALETLPNFLKEQGLKIGKVYREGQFTVALKQVKDYSKGRVFLAGDAAHCHSPVGGRGMNLGIANAAKFAELLSADKLPGYTKICHEEGKGVLEGSEFLRRRITSTGFERFSITLGLKTIGRLPTVQRWVAKELLYG